MAALRSVTSAISESGLTSSFASASATSGTYAGWFGRPRCGIGARYGESVSISRRSSGHSAAAARTSWNPNDRAQTLAEGLRIAAMAPRCGLPVAVDATACLDGFFNGDSSTLHVDDQQQPFADLSFDPGRKMGCPFALEERVPVMRERTEFFVRQYAAAGASLDFIFADWEIDGPLDRTEAV